MLKPEDRLYFIHIPKTAGTTLTPIIDAHFHVDEICPAQLWRELVLLPQEDLPKYRLFRGHFGGNGLNPFLPEPPVCMTMLRHPLPLSISTFKFIWREPGTRVHDLVRSNDMSLSDFLDHKKTRSKISNKQVRHLSFDLDHDPDSGPIFIHPESRKAIDQWVNDRRVRIRAKDRLDRAKARLRECAFFGLVERFDESMALMSYTFGWPPVGRVQKLMVAPQDAGREEYGDEVAERVMAHNELDLELYRDAEALFEERLASMKADLRRYATHDHKVNGAVADDDLYDLLDAHYSAVQASRNPPRRERLRVRFDEPLSGDGWHRREDSAIDGTTFRWTGPATVSWLDLPMARNEDLRVTICIINALADDVLDSLRLSVDGRPMPLEEIHGKAAGRLFQGTARAEALDPSRPFVRLRLEVDRTVSPREIDERNPDTRHVGVAVNWIDVAPAGETEAGEVPRIEITDAERAVLKEKRRRAIVNRLKHRVAALPVVGPRLKDMYIRMKSR